MDRPTKYDTLAFIKQERDFYNPKSLGYKILLYLEELVNKYYNLDGGKDNGNKERDNQEG